MRFPSIQRVRLSAALLSLVFLSSCLEIIPKPAPPPSGRPPEIASVLRQLVDTEENLTLTSADYTTTSLSALIQVGTPAGFRINLRYTQLGVSLLEALKISRDPDLLNRLFELLQWSKSIQSRAEALVTLANFAQFNEPRYFQAALADKNVGMQFAAVEALQVWGGERALVILRDLMTGNWSALVRIYAAQAVLSLGDGSGLPTLYQGLESPSWIVRAMSARYLGEFAPSSDSDKMLAALNRETRNDFVTAELAVSTIKLLARSEEKERRTAAQKKWSDNKEPQYSLGNEDVVEMEPLVIVPPRLYLSSSIQIAQAVNNRLLDLIENRLGQHLTPEEASDPNLQDLYAMVTPEGHALQVRYSELGVVVAEGLAGTNDAFVRTELRRLADVDPNPLVRSVSLLSLGYSKTEEDFPLITRSLRDTDDIVRFGAMEAVQAGRIMPAVADILNVAYNDPVPAYRIFAMQILVTFGDPVGHNLLITNVDNPDWPARAMTAWYLGRYGTSDRDYSQLLAQLNKEDNDFVRSELALAIERLTPL